MANQVLEPQLPRVSASPHGSRGETCRMFENEILEKFSRIHPSTPFLAWVPVTLFFLGRGWRRHDLGLLTLVGLFLCGMVAWTNGSSWGKRIHFLLHGVHHDYPSDKDRLVMPLLTSLPLSVIFYALFTFTLGRSIGEAAFAGFIVGYLFYDGTHYYVHHFIPTTRWGKFLRRHHLTHHHADHDGGFGVSSPLWDLVLQTMPSKKK